MQAELQMNQHWLRDMIVTHFSVCLGCYTDFTRSPEYRIRTTSALVSLKTHQLAALHKTHQPAALHKTLNCKQLTVEETLTFREFICVAEELKEEFRFFSALFLRQR
jgi:hypothetical protein